MANFKISSWNIKHMHDAIAPGGKDAARLPFIREQIAQMDPDILCITEATPDLPLLRQWAATLHVPYVVPTIPGTDAALAALPHNPRKALCGLYGYPDNVLSGSQWIWFLVKAGHNLGANLGAELQDPKIWRRFAASQYADAADQERSDGKWGLFYWAERKAGTWGHVRQPQVLVATIGGLRVELIGAHLRSKLNRTNPKEVWTDETRSEFADPFLREVMNDRIKLATEAENIRKYVDARFAQDAAPAVMVMGDLNDGPGREVFERKHLYFDLIGNLQGSIAPAARSHHVHPAAGGKRPVPPHPQRCRHRRTRHSRTGERDAATPGAGNQRSPAGVGDVVAGLSGGPAGPGSGQGAAAAQGKAGQAKAAEQHRPGRRFRHATRARIIEQGAAGEDEAAGIAARAVEIFNQRRDRHDPAGRGQQREGARAWRDAVLRGGAGDRAALGAAIKLADIGLIDEQRHHAIVGREAGQAH